MNGLLAVTRNEFRHVLRDPYTLIGTTLGVIVVMVLMVYAISADIAHIPIAVFDGDHSPQSRAYLQCFAHDSFFHVARWAASHEQALEWVRTGQVRGAVVVPAGFATALRQGQPATVQIVADGSEPNIALQFIGAAEALSTGFSLQMLAERPAGAAMATAAATQALEFRVRTLYNPTMREMNTFLPAVLAFVLPLPAFFAGLSLVREKEQGSLESLLSTPIRRGQLLIGKAIPYLLIGLLDTLLLTGIGILLFDMPFRGRLADLLLFSTLFLLANVGLGLLIATLLRSQMATLIVGGLLLMLPLTQSGALTPLYAMSSDARMQAMFWPATHYILIVRRIFLKGDGLQALLTHGLYLLIAALLLNGLAAWRLKKRIA